MTIKNNNIYSRGFPTALVVLSLLLSIGMQSCKLNDSRVLTEHKEKLEVKLDKDILWSTRMSESIMHRNKESWMTDCRKSPRWSYVHGLVLLGIQKNYEVTKDERYYNYVKSYYDTMITDDGTIKNYNITDYNIDHINPGKNLFFLLEKTQDKRYETVIKRLRSQLQWHPRTSQGGFWHKLRYPNQMWLDGLYMGSPFYAQYAQQYNETEAFDDITNQFIIMEKFARDEESGLLHHGWDESKMQRWANPQTGKSPEIWGRAMGWYAMGLVDVLDFIPQDHPDRPKLIAIMQRLAEAVTKVQHKKTGTWYQVMDKPDAEGNYLEATVSCMLSYSLIKAVRNGYIDPSYKKVARKAYDGVLNNFVEVTDEGYMHIHKCCAVAGLGGNPYRDGSYSYYIGERIVSNDTKATGPFILASLEFEVMDQDRSASTQN